VGRTLLSDAFDFDLDLDFDFDLVSAPRTPAAPWKSGLFSAPVKKKIGKGTSSLVPYKHSKGNRLQPLR
jgi:hypothetical protein